MNKGLALRVILTIFVIVAASIAGWFYFKEDFIYRENKENLEKAISLIKSGMYEEAAIQLIGDIENEVMKSLINEYASIFSLERKQPQKDYPKIIQDQLSVYYYALAKLNEEKGDYSLANEYLMKVYPVKNFISESDISRAVFLNSLKMQE